ncbi:glycosyl transferase [Ramicandelaber brevisporus]|nr:glycosyl transferase [Ramicandelaber brevisporus]
MGSGVGIGIGYYEGSGVISPTSYTPHHSHHNLHPQLSRRPSLKALHTSELLEKVATSELPSDVDSVERSIVRHMVSSLFTIPSQVNSLEAYLAAAYAARDRLVTRWNVTQDYYTAMNAKHIYYLSIEFLLGRAMDNTLLSLGAHDSFKAGLKRLGFRMEDCLEEERDPGLGNGGLGRLAACYVDSLACLNLPGWGYGLRYTYGMFKQQIVNGAQHEVPDTWLEQPNPWEFPRPDISYTVRFYGYITNSINEDGSKTYEWEGGEHVEAMAYDVPVPGFGTHNVGNIRLWGCKTSTLFDLGAFNAGDYDRAVAGQKQAENLTSVLYPNDSHHFGKELRLKQEYLFVSATLQDIVARFKKTGKPWSEFPNLVAIQLNDTHPTMGVPELQRLLVDEQQLQWDEAWSIVTRTFAFTNHTVLPEALEKWPVPMLQHILPRLMQIIYDINLFFLQSVERRYPGDRDLLRRVSIIEEAIPQQVRMAYLAVVGSHTVNGVAEIHSNIIKRDLFSDFITIFGQKKFVNKTNGISPRRWLHQCNPGLCRLITETLSIHPSLWVQDLKLLSRLAEHVGDAEFRTKWWDIKQDNKKRLAKFIKDECNVEVKTEALFDVQVKRIHEYKRQFLNILGVIHRYLSIKAADTLSSPVPRVVIIGGKAAPGYYLAKLIIKLITSVSEVVNNDPDVGDLLKVVFVPDYKVSVAEVIVPASDISQHISTAGMEASGTSNMKFVLNGGLILGTVDGANIEIAEEIGDDNIFMFGCLAEEVEDFRHRLRYRSVEMDPSLRRVLDAVHDGLFGDPRLFAPLLDTLTNGRDHYLVTVDFASYLAAQDLVDETWRNRDEWIAKSIHCTAKMAKFSSDRAIKEYAEEIWGIEPCEVPEGVVAAVGSIVNL